MVKYLIVLLGGYVLMVSSVGAQLKVTTSLSESQTWQRQAIVVKVEIFTTERFANLIHADSITLPGFEIFSLPVERERIHNAEPYQSVLKTGWSILPLITGTQRVQLPQLDFVVSGALKERILIPVQTVQIKPLPFYIPPTLPVGKIRLSTNLSSSWLLRKNYLSYLNITVTSNSLAHYRLPPVLRQISSNKRMEILPIQSTRTSQTKLSGVYGTVVHQIPFKPLQNGFLDLPELHYQFFDPTTGKMVQHIHRAPNPMVLSTLWMTILFISFTAIVAWMVRYALFVWKRCATRNRLRRQAIHDITQAHHPLQIRNALKLIAQAEDWSNNTTLNQWHSAWTERYQSMNLLADNLNKLSHACYAGDNRSDIEHLRKQFLNLIFQRKRLPLRINSLHHRLFSKRTVQH